MSTADLPGEYREAVEALRSVMVPVPVPWGLWPPGKLIAIDGRTAVGKTTFGRFLAWHMGITLIESDMFLIAGQKGRAYRLGELDRAIGSRLRECLPVPVIVEGIAMLQLLEEVGRRPDFLFYITNGEELDEGAPMGAEIAAYEARYRPVEAVGSGELAGHVLTLVPNWLGLEG